MITNQEKYVFIEAELYSRCGTFHHFNELQSFISKAVFIELTKYV